MTTGSRRSIARLANFVLVAAIAAGAGYFAIRGLLPSGSAAADVAVPDLRGMTAPDALGALDLRSLRGRIAGDVGDTVVAVGLVATQEPAPGTLVRRGTLVQLAVSSGPVFAVVPDVRGRDIASARAEITQAGLVTAGIDTVRDTTTIGRVVTTHPAPNASTRRGAGVTITVSEGMATIAVPAVIGDTREQATARLEAVGLQVGLVRTTTDGRAGTVQAQRPAPGALLTRGSAVELTITGEPP